MKLKFKKLKCFIILSQIKPNNKNNLRSLFLFIVTILLIYIIFDFVL